LHGKQADITFEELYKDYAGKLLNLAYRMTKNEEDARDLTQGIFLKVFQNLHTFRGKSHVYTWVYRIALNHILLFMKRRQRERWFSLLDTNVSEILREESIEPGFQLSPATISADRKMQLDEKADIVWNAVLSLPIKYRVPILLYHYEGMSYKDIAEVMEVSVSAVEARIHRAKKKLIKKLKPWIGKI